MKLLCVVANITVVKVLSHEVVPAVTIASQKCISLTGCLAKVGMEASGDGASSPSVVRRPPPGQIWLWLTSIFHCPVARRFGVAYDGRIARIKPAEPLIMGVVSQRWLVRFLPGDLILRERQRLVMDTFTFVFLVFSIFGAKIPSYREDRRIAFVCAGAASGLACDFLDKKDGSPSISRNRVN